MFNALAAEGLPRVRYSHQIACNDAAEVEIIRRKFRPGCSFMVHPLQRRSPGLRELNPDCIVVPGRRRCEPVNGRKAIGVRTLCSTSGRRRASGLPEYELQER